MMNRYSRHISLSEIGEEGQAKLGRAKVLVVGAGGLGCPVLQYLTAAGVGTIGIIDFDEVEESNLQRQILYGVNDIGNNKALSAKNRLEQLNPHLQFNTYPKKLTVHNAQELVRQYDIVVDGSDNFATRYLVNDACLLENKPLVYGAIYKFEGQVSVFNYQNGPSYRCLFPQAPSPSQATSCAEIGVLGILPGIIGCYQANEVLKIILGIGNPLSGKLFLFNALTNQHQVLQVQPNRQVIAQVKTQGLQAFYKEACATEVDDTQGLEITLEDSPHFGECHWIDIRAPHELPKASSLPIKIWNYRTVAQVFAVIPKEEKIIVCCQSGIRSLKFAKALQEVGYEAKSLKGGIQGILGNRR